MSALAPRPSASFPIVIRRHAFGALVLLYVALLLAAFATGNAHFDAAAAVVLVSLLLSPGLRRRSPLALLLWLAIGAGFVALAAKGHGRVALDLLPTCVNAALCLLFARTLAAGSEPLIARVVSVLEGPERIALPRVAAYARALTRVWAIAFGVQAVLLAVIALCSVPDGLLAALGRPSPLPLQGTGWRWYLHVGSYAGTLLLLVVEYGFRRCWLRDLPHASLPVFVGRLARRWPALVRRLVDEAGEAGEGRP